MSGATGGEDEKPDREQDKKTAGAQVLLSPFLFRFVGSDYRLEIDVCT